MPDILEMMQQNPEMAQSLTQSAPESTAQPVTGVAPVDLGESSWAAMRGGRTRDLLGNPGLRSSLAEHHQAVADAAAFQHQTEQEFSLLHAAHTLHDTASYYQEAKGIRADDPHYEDKMIDLASRYPNARPDAALMSPLHESRKNYLEASGIKQQRVDEKELNAALSKNLITPEERMAADQTGWHPQVIHQLKTLAAIREGQRQPLDTEEREIMNKAAENPTKFQKNVLGTPDNPKDPNYNPIASAQKALYWRANGKIMGQSGASTTPAYRPSTGAADPYINGYQ